MTRHTFGKPLIERQLVRLKFANVGMQVTSTYALIESLVQLWNRARLQGGDDANTPVGGLCALTKVNAARALELAVRESQQIMGALGYTRGGLGGRIERISRDMRVLVIGGGSDEILSEMCLMQESKDLQRIMASSRS
jgi:alkylation response protein AidB-like acyl-CoA dehydrogenase